MPHPDRKRDCLPWNVDGREMLVLGYHGTFQPNSTECATSSTQTTSDSGVSPPQIETIVSSLTAEALSLLKHRIPAIQRSFAAEPVPLNGILSALQQRIRGILAQVIGLELATCRGDITTSQQSLKHNFPALFPLLQQSVHDCVSATATFHDRLHRDSPKIAEWLGKATLSPVKSINGTNSDAHPGGHMVLRIVFRDGHCIYYKPRPVTGEWLWQRLLQTIGNTDPSLRLPVARVLTGSPCGHYGWSESVLPSDTQRATSAPARAGKYWHAAGATLCLAQHVALSDLHLGNIVATPNGPVVTDAECLAGAGYPDRSSDLVKFNLFAATIASLLDTGLLPRMRANKDVDVSGLFGRETPVPGVGVPLWICERTEEYRLTAAPAMLIDHGNVQEKTSLLARLPELLEGYRHAAEVLLRCRKALVGSGSLWRSVLEKEHAPRIVVRDTFSYARLLSRSVEPAYLQSTYRRRNMLQLELGKEFASFPKALLRAELHALVPLHIPRLIALPQSRTLASGAGRPLVTCFASYMRAERVMGRIEGLSPESLKAIHIPALLHVALNPDGWP